MSEVVNWSPPKPVVEFQGPELEAQPEPELRRGRAPKPPRTKGQRALEVLWLLLGLGAIAGIVYGGALLLGSTVLSPQAWAERYVSLIAAGEFSEASALVEPGTDPAASLLLQDGALSPTSEAISEVSYTLLDQVGPSAHVKVAYTLGGEAYEAELSLWRRLSFFGLASEWRVSTPLLGQIRLTTTGPDRLLVGGTEVAVPGQAVYPAYPGVYPVGVVQDERFFELDAPLEVVVPFNNTAELPVSALATEAYAEAAQAAVKALVDQCAASDSITPPGCPFAGVLYDEYKDLSWKIEEYPVVEISPDGTSYSSTSQGKALAKYQVENFAGRGWVPSGYRDSFSIAGTLTLRDGEVVASFDDGAGGTISSG